MKKKKRNIKKALKDFPLTRYPDYYSKKDIKNIHKHGVSFGDVYNADKTIYLHIAMNLHVYNNFNDGVPVSYGVSNNEEDFEALYQQYSQSVSDLRDDFIWLHENSVDIIMLDKDQYDSMEDAEEVYKSRKNYAFDRLSSLIDGLWI